jgi:hypothetical protein
MPTKNGPDARWGKSHTDHSQLAVDSSVSPGGILPGQTQDDLGSASGDRGSSRAVGAGPPTTHQVPMPTEQRLGLDEELWQSWTIKEAAQSCKERPIAGLKRRMGDLAAEHRHFTSEHDDFDGEITVLSANELERLEDSDERQVQGGQRHGPILT